MRSQMHLSATGKETGSANQTATTKAPVSLKQAHQCQAFASSVGKHQALLGFCYKWFLLKTCTEKALI